MRNQLPTITVAVFVNAVENLFHVKLTNQKDYTKYVTVSDAYSKARWTFNNKQHKNERHMGTFQYWIITTNQEDWTVEYDPRGECNSHQQKAARRGWIEKLEAAGYKNCSPNSNYIHANGVLREYNKENGTKLSWRPRPLTLVKPEKLKEEIQYMLDVCRVEANITKDLAKQEEYHVNVLAKEEFKTVNDVWRYVFDKYF